MTVAPGMPSRDRSTFVLLASGAAGYAVGRTWYAEWQVAVESAQVVAGIVTYPADNPFFIYHVKLWTLLHQVCALALRAGAGERVVSEVLSGILVMLTFQALALFVYALSRSVALALAGLAFIVVARVAEFGVVYPVFITGTSHTYGAIGLSWAILTAALLGCGRIRPGLLLLGVAPAIHPSLGAWLWLIVGICAIADREAARAWRGAWRHLAAGCAVTAASLLAHLAMRPALPPLPPDAARYLAAFTTLWDAHRQPVDPRSTGVLMNAAALALAVGGLVALRAQPRRPSGFLLRFTAASAAVGLLCVLVSWVPPGRTPAALLILMPARVLNIAVMTFAALVIGLAGMWPRAAWWHPALAGGVALTTAAGMWAGVWALPPASSPLRDRTNDGVLGAAARGRGLLLTAGNMHLVQLRTRRPVLLDGGALDALPYAREGAPAIERILREVYGIDLFDPPAEALRTGMVPASLNRGAWEQYEEAQWRAIRRAHGVKQVLTPARWVLRLPLAAANWQFTLYEIPE